MTRNQQILLIMSWARSFHGLHLEDCEMLAERVLDLDFDGSIENARPSEVMHSMDKRYFEAQSSGEVNVPESGHVPRWEDHGFVRPPIVAQPGVVVLSDDTVVDVTLLDEAPIMLSSGVVVPVMDQQTREVVLPRVFSNPVGITQKDLDRMVAQPPKREQPKNHVERVAREAYDQMKRDFAVMLKNGWQKNHHHHH